jgi:hypothetical protein
VQGERYASRVIECAEHPGAAVPVRGCAPQHPEREVGTIEAGSSPARHGDLARRLAAVAGAAARGGEVLLVPTALSPDDVENVRMFVWKTSIAAKAEKPDG